MSEHPETSSLRVLSAQILSQTLIFAAGKTGNLVERAILAADTVATMTLGVSWSAFCVFHAFSANMVNVCPLVVGRCTGELDHDGARAAAGQALLLAGGWGAVGIALAGAAGVAAAFAVEPARTAVLFFATQALALGPLLGTSALTGYFTGTMRLGPRILVAVSVVPITVHLALVWLLVGLLSWSVTGAGLARLGAALAALVATFALARGELGGLLAPLRRPNRVMLKAMFTEGSMFGLQQLVAAFIVLLLYLTAIRAGDITSAALTLSHSGVYPLLFSFAWGSSQVVGAAAAQAIGHGDNQELARVTRRCLGLSAVLAFLLPWGAFAVCGRPALAWLIGASPDGEAILTASVGLMGLLAVFFVFDFAINFLSALLRASREQAYLLKTTVAIAAGFGALLMILPARMDGICLIGTFITAQAVWAMLLFLRVASRWPVRSAMPKARTAFPADSSSAVSSLSRASLSKNNAASPGAKAFSRAAGVASVKHR